MDFDLLNLIAFTGAIVSCLLTIHRTQCIFSHISHLIHIKFNKINHYNNNIGHSSITLNKNDIFKRRYFACTIYNDRYILIAGGGAGYNHDYKTLRSVVMYDMCTHTYESLPDLPFADWCHGAVLNGYFYIVRFHPDQIYRLNLFERFQQWEPVVGTTNIIASEAVLSDNENNQLFLFDFHQDIVCYNPAQKQYKYIPPAPTQRDSFATAIIGTKIFLIGGFQHDTGDALSSVDVFDISTQSWSQAPSLPKPLLNAAAVSVLKRWIIVTGGRNMEGRWWFYPKNNTEIFAFDILTQKWTQNNFVPSLANRIQHECVVIQSQMVLLGGFNDSSHHYHLYPMETIHIKYVLPIWNNIKHLILLRRLVDEGRAYSKPNGNIIVQRLMTDISLDLFGEVLTFLI